MKSLSVTIGIPAYNEGRYIRRMLQSVLAQKEIGFKIQKIIVISDGSTDDTVTQAGSIGSKKIQIIANRKNQGRSFRANQLIKLCRTDILVFLDADLELVDKLSVSKIIYPFTTDHKITLVGGNPFSVGRDTFFTRCWIATRSAFFYIRYRIKAGNNVFGSFGSMLAISRPLYRQISIPAEIFAWDSFLYLSCVSRGLKFINVRDAQALHPLPDDLWTHIRRHKRHAKTQDELHPYFGSLVDKEFHIPRSLYLRGTLEQFLKYPIHSLFIYLVNSYSRFLAKHEK